MIMLDRDHLGVLDMRCERNAFGRQVHSFEGDVALDGFDAAVPRRLHPRAVGGRARAGGRRARRGRRASGRRRGGQDPRRRVPSRADRRAAPAPPAARTAVILRRCGSRSPQTSARRSLSSCSRSCSSAATSRCCTARSPTASARTGRGARPPRRGDVVAGARTRRSYAAGPGRARRSPPTRSPVSERRSARDAVTAAGARRWNDANVLALSLRAVGEGVLGEILDAWFATAASAEPADRANVGAPRRARRHARARLTTELAVSCGSARAPRRGGAPCPPARRATRGTGAAAARCSTAAR